MSDTAAEHRAFLALGSNIEPRESYLNSAIAELRKLGNVVCTSSIIETEPVGFLDQPRFLNAVLELRTSHSAEELHDAMREIERVLGRQVRPRWHEREIDLDLLYFDDLVLSTEKLTLPHPEIQNREFVLQPLAEVAPNFVHPVLQKTSQEMLDRLRATRTDR